MKTVIDYMSKEVLSALFHESDSVRKSVTGNSSDLSLQLDKIAKKLNLNVFDDSNTTDVHARLKEDGLHLNPNDSDMQKRFSVAHEIAHIVAKEHLVINSRSRQEKISYTYAGRQLNHVAREFSNTKQFIESLEQEKNNLTQQAQHLYEEVIDYISALMLVPSRIFANMLDKTDAELAAIFKVPEKCIAKRRTELPLEFAKLSVSSKEISSHPLKKALSQKTIDSLLAGV